MPSDYEAIRSDNELDYGRKIGKIGRMLLADRYDDETHFIFELLQNAEDALAKRREWRGQRTVKFSLSPDALSVTHFGKPFDEDDVRGICGIDESTKDLTSIGRFGIGFKSVYAFTDSPEIHSGSEHFAIDSFVLPRALMGNDLPPEQTVIRLPFQSTNPNSVDQIQEGLRRLDLPTLLFLREIEEIEWSVVDGPSGQYMRETRNISDTARKVAIIGTDETTDGVNEEEWIVFSRTVANDEVEVGHVELAFAIEPSVDGEGSSVRPISDSPLVVFFPTVLSTNLGFLVQGPYRTTPSRDNVPERDPWNQYLVQETSVLLVDALRELCQLGLLRTSVLQSLPLDTNRFPEGSRFAPLFSAVREALITERLLPRHTEGYVAAQEAMLARTQELRDLLGPKQLADLYRLDHEVFWLSEDITVDRNPEIRTYLLHELEMQEITPDRLISRLTRVFLEAQSDHWIERLYMFLSGQTALQQRLEEIPIVRLEDGSHVVAFSGEHPQAFLPVEDRTDFPTVRRSVCQLEDALGFLESLGLSPPDPVDDVIAHILPKYDREHPDVPEIEYRSDVERVLAAFDTDSTAQRDRLVSELREVEFILAVDAGDGSRHFTRAPDAYQATRRLKELFAGVSGVLIVDDSKDYLRGERIRALLEAAGSSPYLDRVPAKPLLTWEEKSNLRDASGILGFSYDIHVRDYTLRGLESVLKTIPSLAENEVGPRTKILWESLCDVADRGSSGVFQGEYCWMWYGRKYVAFDAFFVRLLGETSWVSDDDRVLQRPNAVIFESTGWKSNPLLLATIEFKPAVIDELAREAGIEAEVLTLLTQYGLTSVEQFTSQLLQAGLMDEDGDTEHTSGIDDTQRDSVDGAAGPTSPVAELHEQVSASEPDSDTRTDEETNAPVNQIGDESVNDAAGEVSVGHEEPEDGGVLSGTEQATGSSRDGRKFVSYVALISSDEGASDPDDLTQQERMDLEENAIKLILEHEPNLKRTPGNNPGFDLWEPGIDGQPARWVEVKSMTGTLHDRPVGISRTQFECAQKHGKAFWLYIVENAKHPDQARIVQIQDPVGKSETFTFDRGWIAVADTTKAGES